MHPLIRTPLAPLSVLVVVGWFTLSACGQSAPSTPAERSVDSQELARRKILDSDRWRQVNRKFNEWISVQQVYTEEQLAAVRADLAAKVARMSPRELEDFLKDMEARLAVLTSPEAVDARHWLAQFLAVARNPEAQLGRSRPDVLNMTASQIRQELHWLQQHRAARQQSQAAFEQGRAVQRQAMRNVQESRSQSQVRAAESRSRAAANVQTRSQYAPRQQDRSGHSELRPQPMGTPVYSVSPWGHPIHFHPMHGQW